MATKNTKIEIKKSNDILFPYTGEIYEGSDIVVAPGNCAIYLCDGDYEVFPAGTDVLGVKKKKKLFSRDANEIANGELFGVNMEMVQEIKFGVGDINVIEKLTGKTMSFGVSGTYKIQIGNPLMLATRLVGAVTRLTADEIRSKLKSEVSTSIKKVFGDILSLFGRYELDSAIGEICHNLKMILYPKFEFYGIKIVDITISNFTDIDPSIKALINETAATKYTHGQLREVLSDIRQTNVDAANFSVQLAAVLSGKNTNYRNY